MTYSFIIEGRLPSLNEYLQAERIKITRNGKFTTKGNAMKQREQAKIITCIRKSLRGLKITKPVKIHYDIYEENKKRDLDNVLSVISKFTQDSLVKAGVLHNDGWNEIQSISADFYIDKNRPHILVTLTEVEDE